MQPSTGTTARELRRLLKTLSCIDVRRKGSHIRIRCGACTTTIPAHPVKILGKGLLASIERDLEPCLGKGWLPKNL